MNAVSNETKIIVLKLINEGFSSHMIPSARKIAKQLVKAGLVEYTGNTQRRMWVMRLTDAGLAAIR